MFRELMRWNPTEELANWHRDIDDVFGRFFGPRESSLGVWVPRLETYQKDNEYVVRLDLPGVDPKDVHVRAEGNLLTVSGERKTEEKRSDYRETSYGKFERMLTLPHGVASEKITARYEHGVLEVRVPLPAELLGRKIPIQIEDKSHPQLESKAA
jgi:HSP20 family protein